MGEHEEALRHATAGRDWRAECYGYVDRLLDDLNAARDALDLADLEALYRSADAPGGIRPGTVAATIGEHGPETIVPLRRRPFDNGADWLVP